MKTYSALFISALLLLGLFDRGVAQAPPPIVATNKPAIGPFPTTLPTLATNTIKSSGAATNVSTLATNTLRYPGVTNRFGRASLAGRTNVQANPALLNPRTNTVGATGAAQPSPFPFTLPGAGAPIPQRSSVTNPPPIQAARPATNAVPIATPNLPGNIIVPPTEDASVPAVQMRFNNAPLEQVFSYYQDLVGRIVLRSPTFQPTMTINLNVPFSLTKVEAKQALEYMLSMNQITMIPMGEKFVLAVPTQTAWQEGQAFATGDGNQLPEASQFVTQIVRLTNALPSDVMPVIQQWAKIPNSIVPIDSSSIIVLRDNAVNVKRMMEIIQKLDVYTEPDYKLEVIPIRYGKVEDIMNVMSGLIGGGGGGGATGARTTGAGARSSRSGRGGAGGSSSRSTRSSRMGQTGMPGQPNQPGANPAGAQNAFQQRLGQILNRAATGDSSQLLADAKIIPDDRNNSLVVYATKQDMATLTNLVSKLDVMLAQVLIEAVIIDVSLGNSSSLGVSYLQNPRTYGRYTGASAANNGQTFLSGVTNLASGLPSGFSYFANWGADLNMAVSAIAANNSASVLQRPRILTTHAVAANFFSGSQEPYSAGTAYGYGTVASSYVQYLDVGINLSVTPYITPDGLVLMEISQSIDEFQGYVDVGGGQKAPHTTSRTADSTVSVKDGETIILGGFIRSSKSKTRSGVPFLKDIPLLGALFRSSTADNTRSELIVLLRPTVLPNPQAAAVATANEKQRLPGVREAERDFQDTENKIINDTNKKLGNKRN